MLIIKAGSALGDRSKLLLRAVLSKMQKVEALSVNQVAYVLLENSLLRYYFFKSYVTIIIVKYCSGAMHYGLVIIITNFVLLLWN